MARKATRRLAPRAQVDVRAMVDVFQALADSGRLSIVLALVQEHELTPNELARALDRSAPNISTSLRLLSMAGLVERGRRGKTAPYHLGPHALDRICAMLSQFEGRPRLRGSSASARRGRK
jgi:ArsR family transcriptional regulator